MGGKRDCRAVDGAPLSSACRRSGGVGDVVGGGHAWEELHPLASDEEGDVEQGAGARERFAAGPVQQLT